MLGWEFPPFISGGLGTACHGLTRAMTRLDMDVLFVLPKTVASAACSSRAVPPAERTAGSITLRAVPSSVASPYGGLAAGAASPGAEQARQAALLMGGTALRVVGTGAASGYEGDLIGRIEQYAARCLEITRDESFDVIHAHDWVTFPAALAIAARSGKPLVAHVHSTEFDRSGEQVNQAVYDIEHRGMHGAQTVIAVSQRTKRIIVERYGVPAWKVQVVYNGIEPCPAAPARIAGGAQAVLFLGRITRQKGPEYFVRAAEKVLSKRNGVRFIIAGWGDLGPQTVEQVAALGLGLHVRFAGFLRGEEVERAYREADVFVMPSVSEPFGLAALEAAQHGAALVLSKSSGVSEVLHRGALLVDFWDVDLMADRILALLNRPELAETVRREAAAEVRRLTWDAAAQRCIEVYEQHAAALVN